MWRNALHGLRALARRSEADRDDADEIRHFLEEAAAEYEARGLSRREALRRVRLDFGGEMQARARLRDYGWENVVEALWFDVRQAFRRLLGEPLFAGVTVLTLAVGLGAATTIFSAVDTILLRPLPYPDPERIVSVWDVGEDGGPVATTFGTFQELAVRSRSFQELAVMKPWQPGLSGTETPARLEGQRVSSGYFATLGVGPARGRDFRADDDRAGGPRVVILSDGLWRRHFGADPDILDRPIRLDDEAFRVVGVMPPEFENVTAPAAGVWAPLQYDMSQGRAWGHHLRAVGRLLPGVGIESATDELATIASATAEEFPRPAWASLENGLRVQRLRDEITGPVKPALLALLGASGLLLVIVCVNVTLLLLARGSRRRGEFALRAALGAGRERLARQMLTESLVLAGFGGAAGLGLAALGVRALAAFGPPDLPRLQAVSMNATVFTAALGLATLVGIVFGLMPALQAAGGDPRAGLQVGSTRSTSGGAWRRRTRGVLVVAQVALAVVLLVGSGLLLRSLRSLLGVEPGFASENVQTLQVQVSGDRFSNEATNAFFDQALAAVRAVPGVSSAAFTSQLPLSGDHDVYGILAGPGASDADERESGVFRYTVSPGYVEAMGIPLLRGRTFDRREEVGTSTGRRVALISESVARRHLPGVDPIGQALRIGPADRPPYRIVGVVADVCQESLDLGAAEAVYLPAAQWHFADEVRSLAVRTEGDRGSLVADLRAAIWSVDPHRPIVRAATLDELVKASVAERRFTWMLIQVFAAASLLLAAAGLYGVLAGGVVERRREWGVRAALGASRRANAVLVIRRGLALTAVGAALGVVAALAVTLAVTLAAASVLAAMLYGVSSVDPPTYLGVLTLLGVVATAACGVPALRAGRVDPATVLRAE